MICVSLVDTIHVLIWFIWYLHDAKTWHSSEVSTRIGTILGIDCMAGQVVAVTGIAGICVVSFFFAFSSVKSGTAKMNCSLPGWTVSSFCFQGVRADAGIKEHFRWSLNICILGLLNVVCYSWAHCRGWSMGVLKGLYLWLLFFFSLFCLYFTSTYIHV